VRPGVERHDAVCVAVLLDSRVLVVQVRGGNSCDKELRSVCPRACEKVRNDIECERMDRTTVAVVRSSGPVNSPALAMAKMYGWENRCFGDISSSNSPPQQDSPPVPSPIARDQHGAWTL
jgi:hypothetical protein